MKLHTSGQGSLAMARYIKTKLPCTVLVNDDGKLMLPLALWADTPPRYIVGTYDKTATLVRLRADLHERAKTLPKSLIAESYERLLSRKGLVRVRGASRG